MVTRMMTLNKIRIVETAAMVGFISVLTPSQSFFGNVHTVGLLMNIAMISSSNEMRKANRPEDIIPGNAIGKTTLLRVVNRLAPKFIAACSSTGLTPRREAVMTMTTNGVAITVWAMTNPIKVPFNPNLEKNMKTATPVTSMGATIGAIIMELKKSFPGKFPLTRP
mgnify:CR=1 FL=1